MPARSPLFRLARGATWPLRRFFWPQFAWVRAQVVETDHRLHARVDTAVDQLQQTHSDVGRALGTLEGSVHTLEGSVHTLEGSVHESSVAGTEALAQAGQELRAASDWLAQVQDDMSDVKRQIGDISLTSDWLAGLHEQLAQMRLANDQFEGFRAQLEGFRAQFEGFRAQVEAQREEIQRVPDAIGGLSEEIRAEPFRRTVGAPPEQIDGNLASLLNYAESHRGFRGRSDLWLNQPVQVTYGPGGVEATSVNERIVEAPYVFAALHGLSPGARVLDLGSSESTVALSLASLGYRVTALDLRLYPLEHPLLEAVESPLEGWEPDGEPYDAVVCLSSIEHFGVGAYGERGGGVDADRVAAERLRGLLRPGGLLALTVPYGEARVTELERIYDRAQLERLLDGWHIEDVTVIEQAEPMVWRPPAGTEPAAERAVALVRARAPEAAAEA